MTIDRLDILVSLLDTLHLPPIEVVFSGFCAVNIALLVENGMLLTLPEHLLSLIQENLNNWSARHYDNLFENSYSFMNLGFDSEGDILDDFVRTAKTTLSSHGVRLSDEPMEFLRNLNRARRMGRQRKSTRTSVASLEEMRTSPEKKVEMEVIDAGVYIRMGQSGKMPKNAKKIFAIETFLLFKEVGGGF